MAPRAATTPETWLFVMVVFEVPAPSWYTAIPSPWVDPLPGTPWVPMTLLSIVPVNEPFEPVPFLSAMTAPCEPLMELWDTLYVNVTLFEGPPPPRVTPPPPLTMFWLLFVSVLPSPAVEPPNTRSDDTVPSRFSWKRSPRAEVMDEPLTVALKVPPVA